MIGDGKIEISDLDLSILQDKIDENTRFDIWAHGASYSGEHYVDANTSKKHPTKELLEKFSRYTSTPINIYLHSCYGGAAANDVIVLPIESILICLSEEDKIMVGKPKIENLKLDDLIIDFANNIFVNTTNSAIISKNFGESNIFKFKVNLKFIDENPEILLQTDEIIRYFDQVRSDLIKEYNKTLEKDKQIYESDLIKLNLSQAEIWVKEYFVNQIAHDNQNISKSLENDHQKFEKLLIEDTKDCLYFAIRNRNAIIINGFVKAGIKYDLNIYFKRALILNDMQAIYNLISYGADINFIDENGNTPLISSIMNRNFRIVELLLKLDADVNLIGKDNTTPLENAITLGKSRIVKLLLEFGADVNLIGKDNITPLENAITLGKSHIVKLLLEFGANVNIADENSLTPLHIAVICGKVSVIKLLLRCNADVGAINNKGFTPLHFAIRKNKEIINILLDRGADINAIEQNGLTPLHGAIAEHNIELVKLLIERGADTETANKNCPTALQFALEIGNEDIIDLLIENSDKLNRYKSSNRYSSPNSKSL